MRRLAAGLLILAGCASGASEVAAWSAGTSKVKITPPKLGWMTGYGSRNKPADGVEQDLWVRALALRDPAGQRAVMVAADILGFPPALNREIRGAASRLGLGEADLMLTASHTHAGPAVTERPSREIFHGLGPEESKGIDEYMAWLRERVLEAVAAALQDLAPAELGFARGSARVGMNRRLRQANGSYRIADNPEGPVDPDVPVLRVTRAGRPPAVVFTYACHCTTLGGDFYRYHGDWSGVACQKLEEGMGPGSVALFATGCGADLNPSPRGKLEMAVRHGETMAAVVGGAAGSGLERVVGALETAYRTLDLPLEKAPPRDLLEKGLTSTNVYRKRHSQEMLKLLDAGKLPASVPLPLQRWSLGGLTIVAIGGETCVEYALRIKHELGPSRTWVVGYANEVPCYIPSEKVLAEGGYEAGWDLEFGRTLAAGSIMYYGWPVPFAPGIEDRILDAVRALAGR
jgi:hypothetical protein